MVRGDRMAEAILIASAGEPATGHAVTILAPETRPTPAETAEVVVELMLPERRCPAP